MERHVKERLVGAAVMMAAAIILIPEMLSGPRRATETRPDVADTTALKTYTIDLNRSPGTGAAPQPVPEPRMSSTPPAGQNALDSATGPASHSAAQNVTQGVTQGITQGATHSAVPGTDRSAALPEAPATAPVQSAGGEVRTAPEAASANASLIVEPGMVEPSAPKPAVTPARPPAATITAPLAMAPLASAPSGPTSQAGRGWAVQAGSFSRRETAEGLVKTLRADSQEAFVMPVKSGTTTLYRVRVGPFANRAAAEAALREVKDNAQGAAVVAHP